MNVIVEWISSNLEAMIISFFNGLIMLVINQIIDTIGTIFSALAALLPTYQPNFQSLASFLGPDLLAQLNWFIPFPALSGALGLIIIGFTVHYLVFPVLRWFKVVK